MGSSDLNDTNDDIVRKHCNAHYWFGRFLTTAIEFWGQIPKKSENFYHGLSAKFKFDQFSAVYEIPTSTTWDISVAQGFADEGGVVLQLSPKYTDEANNSRCLNVSELSEFKGEKEKLFAGMTVLSITNIYNPSDNKWEGYKEWVASFLYFERIIEQTHENRDHFNYGQLCEEEQNKYLVPLIKYQMRRNGYGDDKNETCIKIPHYIKVLFEYFCDAKKDHIDLSCINEEISKMDLSLQSILFYEFYEEDLQQWKINNVNLKKIFPNLVEYRNHMGNWIYVGQHPGKVKAQ